MNYDIDVELKLIIDHLYDVIKKLDTMNFNELHIEHQNNESTKSRLYDLEKEIEKTRVKLTNVFKIVMSKVNSLQSNEDNKILITHEKNLSSINAIITNLENNMDNMDINELHAHLKWMENIDKELKGILEKLVYYREKLFNKYISNLFDVMVKLEAEEKDKMEDYKLNEYHSLVNQIMDELSNNQTCELQVVIDNETKPILKLENYTQKKINHGIAQISEIVTTKKNKKTVSDFEFIKIVKLKN